MSNFMNGWGGIGVLLMIVIAAIAYSRRERRRRDATEDSFVERILWTVETRINALLERILPARYKRHLARRSAFTLESLPPFRRPLSRSTALRVLRKSKDGTDS